MGKQTKRRPRRARREEAEQRQTVRNQRTPATQLAILDSRLGTGKGAAKERARLMKLEEA
jgi:hypothetical protein